ncbi:oxidoreductase [Gluconacetobacter johannae DSM 13595]|uniref:NAD(P)/FAD-dependent oxidoreductase n=1 Tax=Gluconacetobacter johannae TaxID=112140 RepID=A0A7W4J5T0_9PROT|nr:NAD(P)/FAD-dependent oxidoreductase [Gluconacetobacter johannae]MBB2175201.1 NAD(P)/FAD-dependent oxidoreductase [Gluconacetobacter johannae]GBQ80613.1 oxidoreductase [Gluconacetobacter johannae DSM 13595]
MHEDPIKASDHRLQALRHRARDELARIAHPQRPWTIPHPGPDGTPILDVLIVGAGQSGIAAGFGLQRAQVTNFLIVDQAERGMEGPWLTYARMRTLRSPKEFTGPDLDIPALTYQTWHEEKFGKQDWDDLNLIPREDWAEYLLWLRDTLDLPVDNGVSLAGVAPWDDYLAVTLRDAAGDEQVRYTRKLVLATGQDSLGRWTMPSFIADLPSALRAHTADPIDFSALRNKCVAVLGAGASAFDNAAMALEAGAKEVHLFCRRPDLQLVQPYLWLTFTGFLCHFSELDDAWKWRIMQHVLSLREGFPQATWDRCARHPNFFLHTQSPWTDARAHAGGVELTIPTGTFQADFAICGTGIEIDPGARPELSRVAYNIASWGDRYAPPPDECNPRLSRFPYLGTDYTLQEKTPGLTPWLRHIHLFSIASTMSFGPSGSSINAMKFAVPKLVSGITSHLFRDDIEVYWDDLLRYDVRQAEIRWPSRA